MEVELQFVYRGKGPLFVPVQLADLELRRSSIEVILDTYFDTPELVLRRAGCSLRVRRSDVAHRPRLTFKGPSRKHASVKRRQETEVELDSLPEQPEAMPFMLHRLGLDEALRTCANWKLDASLQPVGELRNRRSQHRYIHGLHRLDLTWDELEFPTGPPQTRLEVEARAEPAERLLQRAGRELEALFGDDLVAPERGKTRELYERLYPELFAA